ncbi:MAG: peptidase T4 [Boseongicola sp.]|nr:MAG: peptidase T4 [Boseongicola sp.]
MKPGARNLITDVVGLTVGQADDPVLKSGVTVLVGDKPMVAGVHVMGGAPGTRETDLLRPDATIQEVDALVMSGGSAFGLSSASGIAQAMAADGRGVAVAGHNVPIVPAAIIFDLANGGNKKWSQDPYPGLGQTAYAARQNDITLGTAGAGTGALVSGLKGGVGSASVIMDSGVTVGALVVVNAVGQVTVGDGPHFWAAPWEVGDEFGGIGQANILAPAPVLKSYEKTNTAIAIVATDARLTKAEATRMAIAAHDGAARAIVPSHLPTDGDLVFACSTDQRLPGDTDWMWMGHAAATCLSRAIARAVYYATPADNDHYPTWKQKFA